MSNLTKKEREVLTRMRDEEVELVQSIPGGWWLENQEVSGRVGYSLLRKCLIRVDYEGNDKYTAYTINETGKRCLDDPNYEPDIFRHIREKETI